MNKTNDVAYLNAVLEMLPDRIFVISEDGYFLDAHGGLNTKVDYNNDELIGRSIHDIFKLKPDQANTFLQSIQDAINFGETQILTYRFDRHFYPDLPSLVKPKGVQWLEARIQALPNDIDGKKAVVWIVRNISESEKLRNQLQLLAETDSLSKLLNRRAFVQKVEKEFERELEENCYGALLILDIDHFKKINDLYGHLAGDKYIYKISQQIQKLTTTEGQGVVGRLGGEEFGVYLPNISCNQAYIFAEKLRKKLHATTVAVDQKSIQASVSIGLSVTTRSDNKYEEVFQRADKALYQSKNTGRNRVTYCSETENICDECTLSSEQKAENNPIIFNPI